MNIEKLEDDIKSLVSGIDEDNFIYDFLLAYELPQASITRLKKGDYNLSKQPGEILWKKRVCFRVDKGSCGRTPKSVQLGPADPFEPQGTVSPAYYSRDKMATF